MRKYDHSRMNWLSDVQAEGRAAEQRLSGELEARMAELGQAQDFDALTAASADLKDLDAQLDVLEEEWLQAAELAEGD